MDSRQCFSAAVDRSFGSFPAFHRAFLSALHRSRGGHVWLVRQCRGDLALLCTVQNEPPCGTVLLHVSAPEECAGEDAFALRWYVIDRRQCAERYAASLALEPLYPAP